MTWPRMCKGSKQDNVLTQYNKVKPKVQIDFAGKAHR
jgi:hypothetical protein